VLRSLSAPLFTCGLLALTVFAPAPALAQDDVPLPRPNVVVPTDPPTFKTTRSLVTVDCVVVDKDGKQVTDLTPADFEVKYSGKVQRLQNVVYVPVRSGRAVAEHAAPVAGTEAGTNASAKRRLDVGPQPGGVRAEAVTRTIAVVVDDLGLSWESTVNVRNALRKFVDEEVAPGDLVAILRTSGGIGALQQFTTDKRLLQAAVERVQWTVLSRQGVTAFDPVFPGERYTDPARSDKRIETAGGSRADRALGASRVEDSLDENRARVLATGSLGALRYVIRGVKDLPGRKAVVFASEGFDLFDRTGAVNVWRAFVSLMDEANRSGVVVYTLDGRGLSTGGLTAEDNPQLPRSTFGIGGNNGDQFLRELIIGAHATRTTQLHNSEEVLYFLAKQTGGLAMLNTNDLAGALARVASDLRGYYLLGYDLPDDQPRGWDPGRVSVRVKRDGLIVRARQGLFGSAGKPEKSAAVDPVLMAAVSPFNAGAITVRLTSLFGHEAQGDPYIRSLLFIDPNALSFTTGADGRHEAKVEIVQLAIGDNGQVPGNWRRTLTLRLTDTQLQDAQTQGVVYNTRMEVKDAGAYQVRTAVRDLATGAMGSASQFVEVPRVGPGRLAVSGVLLRAQAPSKAAVPTTAAGTGPSSAESERDDVLGEPPVRIFRPGSQVVYAYQIYDGLAGDEAADLRVSSALLRDGRVLYRSPETIAAVAAVAGPHGTEPRAIPVAGLLSLGTDVPPGTYALQVIATAGKKKVAVGFADFEVRR